MYGIKVSKFIFPAVAFLTVFTVSVSALYQAIPHAPKGILIGDKWSPETRELSIVFEDQTKIDLGEKGVRTVQLWTEIINGAGEKIHWIVEYSNGHRQEILTQQVRYDRFRTYMQKTFRRKLWDKQVKKLVDVTGPCTVLIVDEEQNNRVIVHKTFTLR